MVYLELLGGASLRNDDGVVTGAAAQRHRVALLALLALAPSGTMAREKLLGLLWPERDMVGARRLLNQSVYVLRRALGEGVLRSETEELTLDLSRVTCDVVAFEEALALGELEQAVRIHRGPLLDGFFVRRAPAFEQWVDVERARLADACATALEELAHMAAGRGELRMAVRWWRARAARDPYDSRVALRLMEALEANGNAAAALRHAAEHRGLLEEELGISAPAGVVDLVERLRSGRSSPIPPRIPYGEERGPAAAKEASTTDAGSHTPLASYSAAPPHSQGAWRRLGSRRIGALVATIIVLGSAWWGWKSPDAGQRQLERGTSSIAAFELYARGSDPTLLRSDSTAWQGVEYLRQAVTLDSRFASAWAALACLYLRVVSSEEAGMSADQVFNLADEAARVAVSLDDSLAEAHAALGLVRMSHFDFDRAEEHLHRAIVLDPSQVRPREWLVSLYLWTGRYEEALLEAERARQLDPLSPTATAELARSLMAARRDEEAFAHLARLESLRPPLLRVGSIAAWGLSRTERWQEAIEFLRPRAHDLHARALLGHFLARAGQREEAERIRADLLERWQRAGSGAFHVATVQAGLGEPDRAIAWLERALEDRSLMGVSPHLEIMTVLAQTLGDHPRFESLFQRLRLGEA